jgi:hypothetical protein
MKLDRDGWLLVLLGCTLPLAGNGCEGNNSSSSRDAAPSAGATGGGVSTGGVPSSGGRASSAVSGLGGKAGGDASHSGSQGGDKLDAARDMPIGGTSDSAKNSGSALRCTGKTTASPCTEQYMTGCLQTPGCRSPTYGSNMCYGDQAPCNTNVTSETCTAAYGCEWQDSVSCTGTPPACENMTRAADCTARTGCTWNAPDAGAGECYPVAYDTCSKISKQADCLANAECTLYRGGCIRVNDPCLGQGYSDCRVMRGCSWAEASGFCSRVATSCSDLATSDLCSAAGCSWTGCTGTSVSCDMIRSMDRCKGRCRWTVTDNYCEGTPTPCDQLSTSECTRQRGCSLSGP